MISCGLQALWMFLLAGVGSKQTKTKTDDNAVVAFFMLFSVSYNVSSNGDRCCYVPRSSYSAHPPPLAVASFRPEIDKS